MPLFSFGKLEVDGIIHYTGHANCLCNYIILDNDLSTKE